MAVGYVKRLLRRTNNQANSKLLKVARLKMQKKVKAKGKAKGKGKKAGAKAKKEEDQPCTDDEVLVVSKNGETEADFELPAVLKDGVARRLCCSWGICCRWRLLALPSASLLGRLGGWVAGGVGY